MKKKLLILLSICILLTGCIKKENNKKDWVIDITDNKQLLEDNLDEIFTSAKENYSGNLDYVALLGTQVVSGTNYMFLCQENGKYKIAVVYNNLENVSQITKITDFDPAEYVNERYELSDEELVGSFYTEIPGKPMMLPDNIQESFDKATETLTGLSFYSIASLAHQNKSGTNYAILCYGKGSYEESRTNIYLLTLYVDKTNKPEIVSIAAVDLTKYN